MAPIVIGGRDVTDLDPKDRGTGHGLPVLRALSDQDRARKPEIRAVGAEARTGPRSSGGSPGRRSCCRSTPCSTASPRQLSGGQRQRVAIGRALVKNVDVFLFDEPLSNLDAKLRTEMRLEIKRLHQELQKTIVFVTHDQVEAMTMANRIAVMNGGVIQQIGTPDEIYERPANLFVARIHRLAGNEHCSSRRNS